MGIEIVIALMQVRSSGTVLKDKCATVIDHKKLQIPLFVNFDLGSDLIVS